MAWTSVKTDDTKFDIPCADLLLDLAFLDALQKDSIFFSKLFEMVFPHTIASGGSKFNGFGIMRVSYASSEEDVSLRIGTTVLSEY